MTGNNSKGTDNKSKYRFLFIFLYAFIFFQAKAQPSNSSEYFKISASRFDLPQSLSGLTDPGFTIWGRFTKTSIGERYYLYLRIRIEPTTPSNPGPGFWYRYRTHNGKIYTDKEIGPGPFSSIRFLGATFSFRVTSGIDTYKTNMGHDDYKRIAEVSKDFDINRASVFVEELIWYNHDASEIRNAIATYEDALKQKEEAKKAKEVEIKKPQEEKERGELAEEQENLKEERKAQSSNNKDTSSGNRDDFWADSPLRTSTRIINDESLRSASQFSGGLDDIEEGGYFKDDKGNYYKKERGNARIVSHSEYDRAQAEKIQEQFARQERRIQQKTRVVEEAINTGMDILTTSFYAQQLSKSMDDATRIGSDFENIDQLNEVFSQKMQEISYLSEELRSVSARNMSTYINAKLASSNSVSEQAGVSAIGILGSVASSISADRAEKKAREKLAEERAEAEAEIKERQREALVNIRNEIAKVFSDGGMPLSSHNLNAPVLYLFAYSADKRAWEEDQEVPFTISNVIPVYRYTDGTYPYTSHVKRTFENRGIKNPTIIGYFTDRTEAERYRRSLLDVAPNAKFALSNIEVKVKENNVSDIQVTSSDTDFWGMPIKKKDTEVKRIEQKKQDDFWNN